MWTEPTSWFCYWDDYEQPNAWVFSVVPKRWKCGIVHLADYDCKEHTDLNYKDFLRALYILSRIQKAAKPDALCLDSCKCFISLDMVSKRRQHGQVVRAPDLKSGDLEFKSRSDHLQLDLL